MTTTPLPTVLVVGGGAAGLSAALVLGRARVPTVLVDAGEQSNLPAASVGGLLGQPRTSPSELYDVGRSQLAELPSVTVLSGRVASLAAGSGARLEDGTTVAADHVLLATGMDYVRPDLPGLEPLWGGDAFHCPYCHGWEHRDGRLAVLADATAVHRAPLLRAWSDDVVVVGDDLTDEQSGELAAAGLRVLRRRVVALEAEDGHLRSLRLDDGSSLERDGVLVPVRLRLRDDLAAQLGCATAPTPLSDAAIVVDATGRTSVDGVWAAGDSAGTAPQVSAAVASGAAVAAALHRSLLFG